MKPSSLKQLEESCRYSRRGHPGIAARLSEDGARQVFQHPKSLLRLTFDLVGGCCRPHKSPLENMHYDLLISHNPPARWHYSLAH